VCGVCVWGGGGGDGRVIVSDSFQEMESRNGGATTAFDFVHPPPSPLIHPPDNNNCAQPPETPTVLPQPTARPQKLQTPPPPPHPQTKTKPKPNQNQNQTKPSATRTLKSCGAIPPAGPPPSTAGHTRPERLLQPKIGWLSLSLVM